MKIFRKSLALAALTVAALSFPSSAQHVGWPENYEGVMLQAFSWDSYTDTKWVKLASQADELSRYFQLIWIPNSGNCSNSRNMGYLPKYWFTNHNSSFGTEDELLEMIRTFKDHGTGMIADVVVNHRVGVSSWTDFPEEEWNGQKWHIGLDGICSNDEVANKAGQPKPTGARDTGENFDGGRDLDHTNANVQDNVKNYQLCLLQKYGYTGFRLDMVKGYAGRFNKMYNEYSKPEFCVAEYWDGSYDKVRAWIESAGRSSAAFDFPCKYKINDAFAKNDMTQLIFKVGGNNPQPAGMIREMYKQYAVTFVDNHDTYRDGSKFTGDVTAANAFILCSPGTPCIFLQHWKLFKSAIKDLINVRRAVGLHNMSEVKVLKSAKDCYMAEVTGSNGKLVVRIGASTEEPEGYSDADVRASGTLYKVWSKVDPAGIQDIENGADSDAAPVYYNMQGVRVDNPSAGLYIVVRGNKVTKEYIR